jgi:hypothetical protein
MNIVVAGAGFDDEYSMAVPEGKHLTCDEVWIGRGVSSHNLSGAETSPLVAPAVRTAALSINSTQATFVKRERRRVL